MNRFSRAVCLSLLLGTAAIAATAAPIGSLTLVESGFIGDLGGLQPQPSHAFNHLYVKPGVDLTRYDSVIVDPVSTVTLPRASIPRIRDADLADICQEFTDQITRRVGETRKVATAAGPSTLEIHVVLTDLIPNRADFAFKDVSGFEKSFGVGGAAVQIEFHDSVTGELLAAVVDAKHGDMFQFNTNKHSVWGDVDEIVMRWSNTIAKELAPQQG
jgi:hypothetical protein